MPTYNTCARYAERLLCEIEKDLKVPGLSPLEILDFWYLRWLTQKVLRRVQTYAKRRASGSRRDLTPSHDAYGVRKIKC